ncbi:lipoprotein [Salinibacterium xinjiangense]|uniref:Predicted lipoprotein n=1 Tax=Salinibacterium xinjiangense TaxID=386302 RepID=A0A2C8Y5U6_9MICO|nr:DUF2291 family protein [Salinibacterium xinjiangense]GGK94851.1 lipoprotein [Salinibacterium xinjiangense]SOE45527.1 Predicted lipoprotein [Salinibacterium xinjiangense]
MKNMSQKQRRGVWAIVLIVVLVAISLSTKVISGAELTANQPVEFNSEQFGAEHFPEVSAAIIETAAPLGDVATALAADQAGAVGKYGVVEGTSFPVFPVTFTAVAGPADAAGFVPFTVDGVPSAITVRIQTGPAIGGTDLRDATGTIHFADFTNQIEYQDAGVALNNELKTQVLAKVKAADLNGKTVTVTGAFQLVNPGAYTITPVAIEVN